MENGVVSRRRRTPAKIILPGGKGLVQRERIPRLMASATDRPIVWVWGAPGAGKTCLAVSRLQQRKGLKLWYLMDAGDRDPITLFDYVTRSSPRGCLAPRHALTTRPTPHRLAHSVTFDDRRIGVGPGPCGTWTLPGTGVIASPYMLCSRSKYSHSISPGPGKAASTCRVARKPGPK